MAKKARIVVVGSSSMDMIVRAPRLPVPGETVLGGAFHQAHGGKGANQAVAAARLGADVTFITRLGTDAFSDQIAEALKGEGIAIAHIGRDPDFPTGVALIGVDETTGENSILVAPGANMALNPAHIERATEAIQSADVLVCQLEIRQDVVVTALEIAHRAGVTTILNPAPAAPLPDSVWRLVSVLTPNEAELEALGGDAAALLARGVGAVVVTLGAGGVRLITAKGTQTIDGLTAGPVVDTTAAGDCFTGALAVAVGEGRSLLEAVGFANAAASLSVTKAGAQPSLPPRAAVDSLWKINL
jgi:ribokinase